MSGPPVAVKTVCPPLAKYPPEMQRRAARELNSLGPTAELPKFMNDYVKMRDACRAVERRTKR